MIKYFQEPRLDKRRIAGKDVCIVCRSLARASPDRAPCSINVKVHQPLIDFLQLPPDYHPFSILGKVDIRAITKQPPTQTNTSRLCTAVVSQTNIQKTKVQQFQVYQATMIFLAISTLLLEVALECMK